jgi:hypothetical protein
VSDDEAVAWHELPPKIHEFEHFDELQMGHVLRVGHGTIEDGGANVIVLEVHFEGEDPRVVVLDSDDVSSIVDVVYKLAAHQEMN